MRSLKDKLVLVLAAMVALAPPVWLATSMPDPEKGDGAAASTAVQSVSAAHSPVPRLRAPTKSQKALDARAAGPRSRVALPRAVVASAKTNASAVLASAPVRRSRPTRSTAPRGRTAKPTAAPSSAAAGRDKADNEGKADEDEKDDDRSGPGGGGDDRSGEGGGHGDDHSGDGSGGSSGSSGSDGGSSESGGSGGGR